MVTLRGLTHTMTYVWWLWIVGGLVVWLLVALVLAVVLGLSIRLADERNSTAVIPNLVVTDSAGAPAPRVRRRAVPLPPVGVALAGLAVGLETVGYALRLNGSTGPVARLLSMDGSGSLPRMYVTILFAAAPLAAGAGVLPDRRVWWLGVGLVAAGIAAVKGGSTIHAEAARSAQ